ncbi:hypothetical protein FOMA001_g5851 [Fusarium oxysporum f. sp. matthiolae]|nr:hypothetical protein FOMA001_g5851 [Fusarium oxysporum f. sp. matthiolae]
MLLNAFLLLTFGKLSSAQVGPWSQCGGNGYTGPTVCQSGWTCQKVNDCELIYPSIVGL